MKSPCINLHMERKKTLLLAASFSLLLFLTILAAFFSTRALLGQLNSLLRSEYEYSATVRNPVGEDDYLEYNAGISFASAKDSAKGINAEIVMRSGNSTYTDKVCWSTDFLVPRELAISKDLARSHRLKAGDRLYSKHIVDGELYEYTIRQVLPELICVRYDGCNATRDGVIVMGYDQQYEENISHAVVLFSMTQIDDLALSISEMPDNLLYRSDEIAATIKDAAPYIIVFYLLSVLLTIGLVYFRTKGVSYNFKRLVRLGVEEKNLNRSYCCTVYSIGLLSISGTYLVVAATLSITGCCYTTAVCMAVMFLGDLLALVCAATVNRKQLWRKA